MSKKQNEDIAERDIEYHYKALKSCQDNFPYRKDIQSNLAEEHAQRGHRRYKTGDYDGAIKEYYRAREQNAEHYPALHQLGLSLHKQGKHEQARIYFQEIISRIHHSEIVCKTCYPEDLPYELDALLCIAYTHIDENMEGSLRKAEKNILTAKELAPRYRRMVTTTQKQSIASAEQALQNQEHINNLLKTVHACISGKDWLEADRTIKKAKQYSPAHPRILAAEQKLRDAVSTTAYTTFKQTLFSKETAIQLNNEENNQSTLCAAG